MLSGGTSSAPDGEVLCHILISCVVFCGHISYTYIRTSDCITIAILADIRSVHELGTEWSVCINQEIVHELGTEWSVCINQEIVHELGTEWSVCINQEIVCMCVCALCVGVYVFCLLVCAHVCMCTRVCMCGVFCVCTCATVYIYIS